MRHQFIVIGLTVLALALFVAISAVLAAPESAPSLQTNEVEPNDTFDQANPITMPGTIFGTAANQPITDTDYFTVPTVSGLSYRATLKIGGPGSLWLKLVIYNQNKAYLTNSSSSNSSTEVSWTAYGGRHYIEVQPSGPVTTTVLSASYVLDVFQIAAIPTPTPQPTNTPVPTSPPTVTPVAGLDSCEDNFDFDHACIIPPNQSLEFNFISPGGGPDNDFYKLWVKPGLRFECRTSDLSPGVDPNMIFYDQNRNGIAGNDDVSPGDYNSALSYFSTYEGWLYILVGTGNRMPTNLNASNYTLRCDVVAPGTPTPLPTNTPRPTVEPGVATATSPPTPTQSPGLTWRLLTTPPPPAAITPAAPRFVPINLLVYYDANNDGQPGAGEGIAGVSAEAYDTSTGQMLAQGFTGEQGNLTFTVASTGPVRVSVPFFGFSQLVAGEGASVYLRVYPQVRNPDSGPAEGTP